jgi:diguanylate cyclase (GGDEF)-like protein
VIRDSFAPASAGLVARESTEEPFRLIGGDDDAPSRSAWEAMQSSSDVAWDLPDGGLAVPVRNQERLIGVITLGRRLSGRLYGGADRRLLAVLAAQAAVALSNALAVSRIHELNQSLESKVDARTSELGAALEALRVKNEQLEVLSSTDTLTGLSSRRSLFEHLERELSGAGRGDSGLSVILIDIDHFKAVNDVHGHLTGDEVLRRTGLVIRRATRKVDICGRIGGEELVVVLPRTAWRKALEVAERIRGAIEHESFEGRGTTFGITASFGVAQWSGTESEAELLDRADAALYRAKDAGRNRVELA